MSLAYFRSLGDYNRWANHRVLEQAARCSTEDYFAPAAGLSFGSLHATLVHILVGEIVWLARWQGDVPPERLKDARVADRLAVEQIRSLREVTDLWSLEEEKQQRFFEALTEAELSSRARLSQSVRRSELAAARTADRASHQSRHAVSGGGRGASEPDRPVARRSRLHRLSARAARRALGTPTEVVDRSSSRSRRQSSSAASAPTSWSRASTSLSTCSCAPNASSRRSGASASQSGPSASLQCGADRLYRRRSHAPKLNKR